jgi:hypothetical protein
MAQYQITVNEELLHQLFLGNKKDSGVAALLESVGITFILFCQFERRRAHGYW